MSVEDMSAWKAVIDAPAKNVPTNHDVDGLILANAAEESECKCVKQSLVTPDPVV